MRFCGLIFLVLLCAAMVGCTSDAGRSYDQQPAMDSLFWPHPPPLCNDFPPASWAETGVMTQPPWVRTRLETLTLSRAQVPALTVASGLEGFAGGLSSEINVFGSSGSDWSLEFCARGEADTETQARSYMQGVSFRRDGGLVTLHGPAPTGKFGPRGALSIEAPAEAPVDIDDSFGAVRVQDVSGPVWVNSARGRTTILNTTGSVDASGLIVDFAGSRGPVILHSEAEINVKLTDTRFEGGLRAEAEEQVRVLLPRKLQTPFEAMVREKKDFVCRAELCSAVRMQKTDGWYTYTYAGDGSGPAGGVSFRSDQATIVIDNYVPVPEPVLKALAPPSLRVLPGGDVTTAPVLVFAPEPEFPSSVKAPAGTEVVCVVGLVVDRNGIPKDVHVVRSAGKSFDTNAMSAVSHYRFKPGLQDGRLVEVAINIQVDFRKY